MALESQNVAARTAAAAITLTLSMIAGIAGFEGFRNTAYIPVPGDVPTIGYGSTKGVKMGDTITPERAMHRLREEVDSVYAQGVRRCVLVPLTDYEFGAYVSLTYNIGVPAFCKSTLVKKLNAKDYKGACKEISRWVYMNGKKIRGLVNRREEERKICEGKATERKTAQAPVPSLVHISDTDWRLSGITTRSAPMPTGHGADSGPSFASMSAQWDIWTYTDSNTELKRAA